MVHVHAADLGAARQGWNRFAGIEQALRVEGVFDGMELREFMRGELRAHAVDFFHTHAVFTTDGTADRNAQIQDLAAQFLDPLNLARNVGVIEDEWV